MSLAVGGWSSEQGLRQLRRDVVPLHPRVVTIYFGWNDHWLAFGRPDADVHPGRLTFWCAEHLRLAQLVVKIRLGSAAADDRLYRVPRNRYIANLEEMAAIALAAGIRPVFITAPSSHQRGKEPEYLARRHVRHIEDLVPLHTSYVEATREAAKASGAQTCDAAEAFAKLPGGVGRYFNHDGIHFNERGSRALAEIVADCLTR